MPSQDPASLANSHLENIKIVPRHKLLLTGKTFNNQRLLLGSDVITVYDFIYLSSRGKPEPAIVQISVPCESPYLLDQSSLRGYLDTYAQQKFDTPQAVAEQLKHELSRRVWAGVAIMSSVSIQLITSMQFDKQSILELSGLDLDRLDIEYPNPEQSSVLTAALDEQPVSETFTSQLLSVKGQDGRPVWASLQISYTGPQIEQTSLLFFILQLQQADLLPEATLELIFNTIQDNCKPTKLAVYAKFCRQQQMAVSSFRANYPIAAPAAHRTARQ